MSPRRRQPRRADAAIDELLARSRPSGALALAQQAWPRIAGEAMAARTRPVAEREGTLTVACESSVWASELSLMETEIVRALTAELGDEAPVQLRFVVEPTA